MPEKSWAGVSEPRGFAAVLVDKQVTTTVESTVSEDDANCWCRRGDGL